MLKRLKYTAFSLMTMMAFEADAAGTYDGIWTFDQPTVSDYFSLHQNGNTVILADLDSRSGGWDAYQGTIDASNKVSVALILSMLYPGAKATVSITFSSPTTGTLKVESCAPPPNTSSYCTVPAGTQIPLKKVF